MILTSFPQPCPSYKYSRLCWPLAEVQVTVAQLNLHTLFLFNPPIYSTQKHNEQNQQNSFNHAIPLPSRFHARFGIHYPCTITYERRRELTEYSEPDPCAFDAWSNYACSHSSQNAICHAELLCNPWHRTWGYSKWNAIA